MSAIHLQRVEKRFKTRVSYRGLTPEQRQFLKLEQAWQAACRAIEQFWRYEAVYQDGKADQERTDWERLSWLEQHCDKASARVDRFVATHTFTTTQQAEARRMFLQINIAPGGSY